MTQQQYSTQKYQTRQSYGAVGGSRDSRGSRSAPAKTAPVKPVTRSQFRRSRHTRTSYHFANLLREILAGGNMFDTLASKTWPTVKPADPSLDRTARRDVRNREFEDNLMNLVFYLAQQGKLMTLDAYNALLDQARSLRQAEYDRQKDLGQRRMERYLSKKRGKVKRR